MPTTLEDYEQLYEIGSGSYGKCKKIRRRKDNKMLVWKEMDYGIMTEAEKQMLVSEVNLLRELKHEHIVRYYDRIIDRSRQTIYIVMEYCEGGDLATLISKCRKDRRHMDEDFVWKILIQVVLALKECHRRKGGRAILHRDLKPANVFLDMKNNVKLGDFGLARVLHHETSFAKTFVGTPYYMSPEQMNYTSYNDKSDIWSLGCMIYELCSLHPPFTAANQKELAVKIKVGIFCRIPRQYSTSLNDLIEKMLRVECERRPSIESILQTPIVTSKMHKVCQPASLTSSGESEAPLKKKEQDLKEKEKKLEKRTKELDERENDLERREKLVDEKIFRLEYSKNCVLKENRIQSTDLQDFPSKAPATPCLIKERKLGSPAKRVHFSSLENTDNLLGIKDNIWAHKAQPKVDIGRYGDVEDYAADYQKRLDLRERLRKAKDRSEYLRRAEYESKYRSRQLLAMR